MAYGLNLNQREKNALSDLARKKVMSKKNILKASFRLYQSIEVGIENGTIPANAIEQLFQLPKKRKKK